MTTEQRKIDAGVKRYFPHEPARKVAARLGCAEYRVYQTARRLGISKRLPGNRRYAVREDFFHRWSPRMAYVLGLVMADGCLVQSGFEIVSTDEELLMKAKLVMGSSHPVRLASYQSIYRLRVGSVRMRDDLLRMGVGWAKSKTLRCPDVPDELFFHLLRGYFDGDGHASMNKARRLVLKLTAGGPDILSDFDSRISRLLGMEPRRVVVRTGQRHGKPTSHATADYCGPGALAIAHAMYERAGKLYLERKRAAFVEYENRPNPRVGNARKYS